MSDGTDAKLVAFRMHLPSKITYHNAGAANMRRGNILVWEQPLADRLRGEPMVLDAQMQTQSILYRTISLFGVTFLAAAATFAIVILLVLRAAGKGRRGRRGRIRIGKALSSCLSGPSRPSCLRIKTARRR